MITFRNLEEVRRLYDQTGSVFYGFYEEPPFLERVNSSLVKGTEGKRIEICLEYREGFIVQK